MLERDGMHRPAAREHGGSADDALGRPVAPLDQHLGPAGLDQPRGGVLVEPRDRVHRPERRDERHAVGQRIDRPAGALAQAPGGRIAVQRHHQRRAERPRAGEIGDMAAMQQVEHAVGEHQRARRARRPARRRVRIEDLALEVGRAGA